MTLSIPPAITPAVIDAGPADMAGRLAPSNGNEAELSANGTSAGLISTQTSPGGIDLDRFNLSVAGNNDTFWGDITNSSAKRRPGQSQLARTGDA